MEKETKLNGETMNGSVELANVNAKNVGHLAGQSNLSLHFNNVCYTNKQKIILNLTCGELKSGRLTAILGPSGAGKTSMLNVLSGFKAKGVSGQIEINGQPRNLEEFRKLSSYITQDFAMLDLLTVQETLKVSTDLKLSGDTSLEEKFSIIDEILNVLNMEKCRNTLVRDISGGERKRLSIGIELVTNPPIMFFDEPTSGLDSVASLQVLTYLHRLARGGRIIVCVVHQPSSRLMKLFDDIMVMSKGEVLYSGPQYTMLNYFENAGFTCPKYYNPADFVLEVGSEEANENISLLIQRNKQKHCKDILGSRKNSITTEKAELLALNSSTHVSVDMNGLDASNEHLKWNCKNRELRPKERVSIWRQLSVLMSRSLRSMSRNLMSVQLRLVMHLLVAVILGVVFYDIGNDGSKVFSNSSCIFFVIMFIFFANSMPSVLLCPQDTAVFIREYLNGWYSMRAYYISKIVVDIPMQFICPTVFVGVVYYMTGQPNELGRFLMCWGVSVLIAIIGHFIGLVFGSTFELQMAIFLVPGVCIPFMIFSGFFIRLHELIPCLRPVCDVSFFRYAIEGLMQGIYGFDRPDLKCNIEFCYLKSPHKLLKDFDMWGDRFGVDMLALSIWIVALMLLFYMSLILRVKRSK